MARFTYPYEITKLYATKEKEPDRVDTEISYAFAIQENFDIIRKYLNEIIDADNIVQNSITGGTEGSLALTTITGDNIFNNTITGTQLATDSITLANLGATWTNWTPTYSAGDDMTITSTATYVARYCRIDKMILFVISFDGTTGGTASTYLRFTLPVEAYSSIPLSSYGGGCLIWDGTAHQIAGSWSFDDTPSAIAVFRYDDANFGLGAVRGATVQGFYEID